MKYLFYVLNLRITSGVFMGLVGTLPLPLILLMWLVNCMCCIVRPSSLEIDLSDIFEVFVSIVFIKI